MNRDSIILYNEKMFGIGLFSDTFGSFKIDDISIKDDDDKEGLKRDFDLLSVRKDTLNFERIRYAKIVYLGAIGELDDEQRYRSKEIKRLIKRLIYDITKANANLDDFNNGLELIVYGYLLLNKDFIRMLFCKVIENATKS